MGVGWIRLGRPTLLYMVGSGRCGGDGVVVWCVGEWTEQWWCGGMVMA